jgi:hypothetical protein
LLIMTRVPFDSGEGKRDIIDIDRS